MYRLIIIDDEEKIVEGMGMLFPWKTIGFSVEGLFTSAVEALEFMENNQVDVVLSDIEMPDMDGIETARQIRKRIGKEITIIVLTSYEFSEIEEEAKAAGIDAFIAKPLFRSRLTATLRQFTSGKTEKTARKGSPKGRKGENARRSKASKRTGGSPQGS